MYREGEVFWCNKLRAHIAIPDLRGLQFYNIFIGTTKSGAVGEILKMMLSRLLQSAKSRDFMGRGQKSVQNGAQSNTLSENRAKKSDQN